MKKAAFVINAKVSSAILEGVITVENVDCNNIFLT
jgi:hypothetical protein